jgi:hypothetical protein
MTWIIAGIPSWSSWETAGFNGHEGFCDVSVACKIVSGRLFNPSCAMGTAVNLKAANRCRCALYFGHNSMMLLKNLPLIKDRHTDG